MIIPPNQLRRKDENSAHPLLAIRIKPASIGTVLHAPSREEIPTVADEKAAVEFYSG